MYAQRYRQFLPGEAAIGRQTHCRSERVGFDFDGISARVVAEMPQDHLRCGGSMLVIGQEQLVAHRAIRRNQVISRERHPVHHLVIFWNVGVQYPECADNFATDIRQERILDVVSRAESFENFARVIGN
jgi:hypothetical protein